MKIRLPLFAVLFALIPTMVPGEEGHLIPVDRALKAGDKIKLAIEGDTVSRMVVKAGGEIVQDEDTEWKASLEATRTIDKIDARGDATQLTLEIHKSSVTRDGKTGDLLPAGTVVKAVAKPEGKDEFSVEGEPVEESVREVLNDLVDLAMGEGAKGDENKAFGVDQPRKPGDEWDMNVAELIATLPPEIPLILDPAATKGKMKFVELTDTADGKAALLQGQIELVLKGLRGLPPNASFDGSSFTVALDGIFPLDPNKPAAREGMSMIMTMKAKIPTGDGKVAEMNGSSTSTRKTRVLP
jgi:hypothetical protein